ncbi:C-terminal binding protein [Rhodococcus sp. NPDC003318]|uniref:C-terminal binding protein n=1 Tax=Rhodococcus sp. NPDC003318 TaxID=3364503 RepID=UPI0036BF3478
MYKIVVTDYEFADLAPEQAVFDGHDIELVAGPFPTREALAEACRDADAILNQYTQLDAQFIAGLQRCRVISRYGIGTNTIDLDAATAAGIMVANVPDGSIEDVSDHAAAMILALSRGLGSYDRALRNGVWDYAAAKPLHRLRGGTLGLVGFGNIPQRLARKMAVFGMETVAFDPYVSADEASSRGARPVGLDELLTISDVVSVHVPLTASTRGSIGRDQLALMKRTAILINTARGGVVDDDALAEALRAGRIRGAGLDVFTSEPISGDSAFTALDNTLLSPHAAWYSEESELEIRRKTAHNALTTLTEGRPTYLVNREVTARAMT